MPRGIGGRARALNEASDEIALLQQRETRLRARIVDMARIIASLGEGVVAVDGAGIVLHANRAAIDLLTMDPQRAVGHHVYVAVPSVDVSAAIEAVMRGDSDPDDISAVELEVPVSASVSRILRVRVGHLRAGEDEDAGAEAEGALAVVQDITEQRRAEQARADFFSNVSHELKTPVAAISGIVETLAIDVEMDVAVRQDFLARAARQASRLDSLIVDLLGLSRIASDPGSLDLRDVDVRRIVAAAAASMETHALRSSVTISIEPASDSVRVTADEEALLQAVTNLVSNAVAHSPSGAVVSIEVGVTRDESGGALARVAVTDHGVGIAPEHLDRIFERFYRVDAARSRERGGTGLGLSIVKHVMIAHGGEVAVISAPGLGSTFTLTLPAVGVDG